MNRKVYKFFIAVCLELCMWSAQDAVCLEEEQFKELSDDFQNSKNDMFSKIKALKETQEEEIRRLREEIEDMKTMILDTVFDYEALSFNEIGAYEELPPVANFTLSIHNVWNSKGHFQPGRSLTDPIIINYNEHYSMHPDCLNLKGLSPNRHVLVYVERSCVRLFIGKYCQGAYATFTNPRVIKPYNFAWRSVGPCKYVHFT